MCARVHVIDESALADHENELSIERALEWGPQEPVVDEQQQRKQQRREQEQRKQQQRDQQQREAYEIGTRLNSSHLKLSRMPSSA